MQKIASSISNAHRPAGLESGGPARRIEVRRPARSERLAVLAPEGLGEGSSEAERLANRLNLLLGSLPGGVIVLGADGVVRECNPAAARIFGRDLHGVVWRDVVSEAVEPRADDECDVSLRNGRRVSITTCSLGSEPGQILLFNDVTEKRELQARLMRMNRLTEMGRMMAGIAHQIRTPLASALLYGSTLSGDGGLCDASRRANQKLLEHLRHLEALVDGMLSFVRHGSLEVGSLRVGALMHAFKACLSEVHDETRITLALDVDGRRELLGNLEALASVFRNLVLNAREAGGERVCITLSARHPRDGTLEVALSDDGPGIPARLQAQIFEPFITGRADGTGLGLSMVRRVVEAHGGSVSLASVVGRGSTFTLALPLREIATARENVP